MTMLGKRLVQAAHEARAIARGDADPATYRVHVASDVDVAKIRGDLGLTQAEFARAFGFPAGTVRDWEQGRRQPDTAARAYLTVIGREPEAVRRALQPDAQPAAREPAPALPHRPSAGRG
jgi:putative transcriptional regulator